MKYLIVLSIIGLVLIAGCTSTGQVTSQSTQQAIQNSSSIIDACEAVKYIGEFKTIKGYVADVFVSNSNTVFINFKYSYPNHCFTAVIFPSDKNNFGNVYDYEGKNVQVEGTIQYYESKPEIILKNTSQIIETNKTQHETGFDSARSFIFVGN